MDARFSYNFHQSIKHISAQTVILIYFYVTVYPFVFKMFQVLVNNLSDSSLATAFPTFCDKTFEFAIQTWQNLFRALLRVCINILFVSTPKNVDFAH